MWQRQVPQVPYVAKPRDETLPALLNEAFKVLEYRFAMFDSDDAGKLMFQAIQRDLSKTNFKDEAKLTQIFRQVDLDQNGTLDFSEFLCLIYLWIQQGDLSHFFRLGVNSQVVKKAFDVMARAMLAYDADGNRRLSASELDRFFGDHLPAAKNGGTYEAALTTLYPELRKSGAELKFPQFMFLLYFVMCDYPESTISGKYKSMDDPASHTGEAGGVGEQSALWIELKDAFGVVEADFVRFDNNNNLMVDFDEITQAMPVNRVGNDRIDIMNRLEFSFNQVDLDRSRSLDFYEFMYLSFMMTQNGSYHDLVAESTGSALVKRAFINIHSFYRKYDEDGNLRLSWPELEKFCQLQFGCMPAGIPGNWEKVKYQSRSSPEWVVDVVRFMKLLYMTICPQGRFHPDTYNPTRAEAAPESNFLVSIPKSKKSDHPPRIEPVRPANFQKSKLLGKGGQGEVYLGSYDSMPVAGKTLLGSPDKETVDETIYEVKFFEKLDHPNCHYLLGAKTSLDDGGIMLLTEVCEHGSLFDFYNKTGKRFDMPTAWRLARECATGLMIIHNMGYMHRDIKSLNVFLSKDMVAKVADFGMVTENATATDACGTVQWMAPEVVLNLFDQRSVYDKRVDVYSYGVLLWEIFHCKVPYSNLGLGQMSIGKRVMDNDIRPQLGRACPKPIEEIIKRCWARDANQRPTFEEVIQQLDQCASSCGQ